MASEHKVKLGVGEPNPSTRDTALTPGIVQLPQFPGDDFLAHDATAWLEQAEPRLGKLLAVAQGQQPAAAAAIIDIFPRPLSPPQGRAHGAAAEGSEGYGG